ncbi:hypothetical protein AOL_s00076g416 [Orbilia oligospora ATCC 24927]|uniref:Uncharacterized protein n=1 Tax=Arthrobotrys oligospora (strain ATCC 24927 / CBS 115.81 / DSM 1491) TaxID=756982 RepID=G1X9S7_ARTOA|nr:hypothetical protein AOL_s00076g416 [Orbilia oligospora ATCC 24927]EGX50065.1 hypothetical protein AOL_s00076g416 [Orbilia oligospora ATCC 24927]
MKAVVSTKPWMSRRSGPGNIRNLVQDAQPIQLEELGRYDLGAVVQDVQERTEYRPRIISRFEEVFDGQVSQLALASGNASSAAEILRESVEKLLKKSRSDLVDVGKQFGIVKSENYCAGWEELDVEKGCGDIVREVELLRDDLRQLQRSCLNIEIGRGSSLLLEIQKEINHYDEKLTTVDLFLDVVSANRTWTISECTWQGIAFLFKKISGNCSEAILNPEDNLIETQIDQTSRHPLEFLKISERKVTAQKERIQLLWNILRWTQDKIEEENRLDIFETALKLDLMKVDEHCSQLKKALAILAIFENINLLLKTFSDKIDSVQTKAATVKLEQMEERENGLKHPQAHAAAQAAQQVVAEILRPQDPNKDWFGILNPKWTGRQLPEYFWDAVEKQFLEPRAIDVYLDMNVQIQAGYF